MRQCLQQLFKLVLFTLLLTCPALSHPHTFIEVHPTIEIQDHKLSKMHVRWKLDEMTSMMLITELDANADGQFDEKENSFIYDNFFSSLKQYNFYTHILSHKKSIPIKPKNFKASIEKEHLIYAFDLEPFITVKDLQIAFFDLELFVGMMLEKKNIILKGVNTKNIEQLKKTLFGIK